MADLGSLVADLVLRDAEFNRNIQSAGRNVNSFASKSNQALARTEQQWKEVEKAADKFGKTSINLKAVLSGLSIGGLAMVTKSTLDATTEMKKNADMAGVTMTAFQEWTHAADQYSVSQDALTDGLKELNLRAEEFAVTGSGPGKEAFERLGYSQGELNKKLKDTPALLLEIIDRMQDMEKASKMRIADEIFGGQGGEQFVSMINGGSAAIRQFTEDAHKMGLVLDGDAAAAAIRANKSLDTLGKQIKTQFSIVVAELAPVLDDISTSMADWVASNQDLIKQKVPEYFESIKTAASGAGTAISWMAKASDAWADHWKFMGLVSGGYIPADKLVGMTMEDRKKWLAKFDREQNGPTLHPINDQTPGYADYLKGNAPVKTSSLPARPSFVNYSAANMTDKEFRMRVDKDTVNATKAILDQRNKAISDYNEDAAADWKAAHEKMYADTREMSDLSSLAVYEYGVKAGTIAVETTDVWKDAFSGWASSFSSELWDMVKNSERSFDQIGEAFTDMLGQMVMQKYIAEPFMSFAGSGLDWLTGSISSPFGGAASSGGGAAGPWISPAGVPHFDTGGVMGPDGKKKHFPAMIGEDEVVGYPEQLAGMFGGSSAVVDVQIIDQRGSSAPAIERTDSQGPDGRQQIRFVIKEEVKGMFGDGSMDKTMRTNYGVSRQAIRR